MKRTLPTFLLVLLCVSLLGNVAALGGVVERQITVSFAPLKYYFDTYQMTPPSDKTGFIYNGTTYVPLRWMCETLGKEVLWDGPTYSIWVGRQPDGTITKLSAIQELPVRDYGEWEYKPVGITVLGQHFKEAYIATTDYVGWNPRKSFMLDSKYSRFEGYFGVSRFDADRGSVTLVVTGDGRELYRVTKGCTEKAEPISFDTTGVNELLFEIYYPDDEWSEAFIGEPILIR